MKPYSERKGIGRPKGWKMSEESRQKIKKSMIGITKSEEIKQKISNSCKNKDNKVPIDIIMKIDLETCKKYFHNRYINIYIPNPISGKHGITIRYHVVLVEQKLGRKLKNNEEIHHIDLDKTNNNLENLMIMTVSAHRKLHAALRSAKRLNII